MFYTPLSKEVKRNLIYKKIQPKTTKKEKIIERKELLENINNSLKILLPNKLPFNM